VTARSRASAVVAGSVAGLPAASLAEVIERSALQTRIDHKYLVPLERFAELAARLPDTYAVLEIDQLRGLAYESVYFDTPDLLTYRQHLQGRRRRYKVRTRAYLDSGDCTFEVKLRGRREQTIKARLPYPVADRTHINPRAQAFLADQLREAYGQPAPRLAAKVTTAYRRTTLVDLQRGTRLTYDVDLICGGGGKMAVGLSRHVLVETKRAGPHGDADIALRSLGLRPVEMSKYCVAVALLYPGIRRNPWHRTLRRYFADATQSAPGRDPNPGSLGLLRGRDAGI
jgi:VTC domain